MSVETAVHIVKCIFLLHNIVVDKEGVDDRLLEVVNNVRQNSLQDHNFNNVNSRSNYAAIEVRYKFMDFLTTPPLLILYLLHNKC